MTENSFATVLGEDSLTEAVRGKNIALMVNSTAITKDGGDLIDMLYDSGACKISFIFGMEHGVRCTHSAGERDTVPCDEKTGIPIIDLYEYPERRPPVEPLRTVDAVVYSTQDAGVRHWTFTPWLFYLMDSAAEAGCPVIILDRPNPLGGVIVEGNLCEQTYKNTLLSGFGYPLRHGMTVGELALMYKDESGLSLDLTVIPMSGWKREMLYPETGLIWRSPTPNIITPDTFFDFAICGLLQSSDISLGDNTGKPFGFIGRPEFDGERLAAELNSRGLADVRFKAAKHVTSTRWEREILFEASGVEWEYEDKKTARPVRAQLHLIDAIAKLYSDFVRLEYKPFWARKRMGCDDIYNLIEKGESVTSLIPKWEEDSRIFEKRRKPYLLYG